MAGAAAAMDEGGELLAGNGRRQRHGEEGGEAGVVLVELGGGVAGRHGSAKGRVRTRRWIGRAGEIGGDGDRAEKGSSAVPLSWRREGADREGYEREGLG